ncbi:FtsW/RodA/SpoVE family cell cycle protein [Metabacillus litoralis]|uniref:FtsW/RodA/SpoVE family cell cycle protein n=1 Tax=Metabacillus litoralis TaxID=152268 RepID=UPI00203A4D69|nr:FtsW/RodA/SpoVE family cell cycle protein [Metabacillus litoralis]MCM3409722.1 FtsW/RodA/SpoVE family cell cycle protein [Metabacillus litoralis]
MKNKKHIFLSEVTTHIKSKEAREYVTKELDFHLTQGKKGWMEKGIDESEAEERAIEQMGSPIELGRQFNKIHRPRVDWLSIILLVTTLCLGFLPLFPLGYMDEGHFITYKIVFTFLGSLIAIGLMLFDYKKLIKLGWFFYTLGILMLFSMLTFTNTTIGGLPVLRIGPITLESLMAVPFFFFAWASFFHNRKLKVWHFSLLFFISTYLFLIANSIATTFIYIVMVISMLGWSKFNRKTIYSIWGGMISFLFIIAGLYWRYMPLYLKDRILGFLNPEKYATGAGYPYLYAKEFIYNAGWFGNSTGSEFIPQAHTDFVFVTFTYYYGWMFAMILVIILSLFVARIVVVFHQINDSYGKLLLVGAVTLYAVQLFCNIGMVFGIFPMTSMSLPFISYGFMPTLFNAVLIGIVLSVYRRKSMVTSS